MTTKKLINPVVMLDDLKSRVAVPTGKKMEIGWFYEAELPTLVCADKKAVVFTVADTGIGIPEESRSLIFESFHKGSIFTVAVPTDNGETEKMYVSGTEDLRTCRLTLVAFGIS